ncbi:MAG: phytanoyl-CoA dioxygenase family protein [Planctomycetota bacterium]|nr:phytanoyl-CoA dioxygenase family protein [Planctomycetota bacterium]MDA1143025.1 phytanoyl-CoA dioxygenase family protein [Planctomycetota bacterium]
MNPLPSKPELPYRYEFQPNELDEIEACNEAHGFALVKGLIDDVTVNALRTAVKEVLNPKNDLEPRASRTGHAFVENSDALFLLLQNEEFLAISRKVTHSEDLTINRSAAIVRNLGSAIVSWHSDWSGGKQPERLGQALNHGEWPSGLWFYLNGSCPKRGGLCIMEDSHKLGWTWPKGYTLNAGGTTFTREGEEEPVAFHEVPGCIPLFTEPNDLIVFAARTYHAAFTNQGPDIRLSVGLNFRPRGPVCIEWEPTPDAVALIGRAPDHVQPFLHHYTGFSG